MVGRPSGGTSSGDATGPELRPALLVVLTASLVVLSGCPGDPEPGEYPPGANETGVSEEIVEAHDAELTSLDSYTYVVTRDQLVAGELQAVEYRLRADADDGRYLSTTAVGDVTRTAYYANGTSYRKQAGGDGTSYEVADGEPAPTTQVRNFNARIERLASTTNLTFQGSDDGGDETLYRYTASNVSAQFVTTLPASNVSVEFAVTREGLVRTVRFEYDVLLDGERNEGTFTVELRDVNGTSVSRPGWIEAAVQNASDRASASVSQPIQVGGA
jgi:hypothetical protein